MNQEQLRMTASEAIGDYLLENVHRVVYGRRNLEIARKHLENGGSLLVFANHFAKLDPMLYARAIREYITPLNHASIIGSRRHFDPKQGPVSFIQSKLGPDWEKIYGVTLLQVVQEKDHDKYKDWAEFNSRAVLKAAKKLRREPGSIVFITPEGTRSDTDKLLRAEEGLDSLLKLGGERVLALPLGAIHKTILPGRRTTVIAGELFSYQDLLDDQTKYLEYYEPIWRSMGLNDPMKMPDITASDCAMARLAASLPIENQGIYTNLVAIRRQLILNT